MKITVCGSLKFINEMKEVKLKLKQLDHEVLMPESAIESKDQNYWNNLMNDNPQECSRIRGERIKLHFNKINSSEAILILNYSKKEKENYIGANTFLEMGYAFGVDKKIFVLNQLPKDHHYEELIAMNPICLYGDLNLIN
jgi:hypothetical protein